MSKKDLSSKILKVILILALVAISTAAFLDSFTIYVDNFDGYVINQYWRLPETERSLRVIAEILSVFGGVFFLIILIRHLKHRKDARQTQNPN